jgi:hypothetical protein
MIVFGVILLVLAVILKIDVLSPIGLIVLIVALFSLPLVSLATLSAAADTGIERPSATRPGVIRLVIGQSLGRLASLHE